MKEEELRKWHSLLLERKASCYFKPTRLKHESGFRIFETGYCTLDDENKVKEKFVHGECSDHINTDYMGLIHSNRAIKSVNLDLTMDGYIRIWASGDERLCWEYDDMGALSTATLQILAPLQENN